MTFGKSRGAYVMDAFFGGFRGIATADAYGAYRRFGPGGRRQLCWAHILRMPEHVAPSSAGARRLHAGMQSLYARACRMRGAGPAARLEMEAALEELLAAHRGAGDEKLARALASLDRAAPFLPAFVGHRGVGPANNAAERALRYVVVFRKISGQLEGGDRAARRMSDFLTCVLAWNARGKKPHEGGEGRSMGL